MEGEKDRNLQANKSYDEAAFPSFSALTGYAVIDDP